MECVIQFSYDTLTDEDDDEVQDEDEDDEETRKWQMSESVELCTQIDC